MNKDHPVLSNLGKRTKAQLNSPGLWLLRLNSKGQSLLLKPIPIEQCQDALERIRFFRSAIPTHKEHHHLIIRSSSEDHIFDSLDWELIHFLNEKNLFYTIISDYLKVEGTHFSQLSDYMFL